MGGGVMEKNKNDEKKVKLRKKTENEFIDLRETKQSKWEE